MALNPSFWNTDTLCDDSRDFLVMVGNIPFTIDGVDTWIRTVFVETKNDATLPTNRYAGRDTFHTDAKKMIRRASMRMALSQDNIPAAVERDPLAADHPYKHCALVKRVCSKQGEPIGGVLFDPHTRKYMWVTERHVKYDFTDAQEALWSLQAQLGLPRTFFNDC